MATKSAQGFPPANHAGSSASVTPGTRSEMLDRLAAIVAKLGVAKLELANALETRDVARYESAQSEVEKLRLDCNKTRFKLEHFRLQT